MNSLKSIMSRMTTLPKAVNALNAVGVSIKDMSGNIRPVSDVISELAGKWSKLSDEQKQNTAINVAGTYQLTRFTSLMQNFGIAQKATATSMNSAGSSMKEQEKFANSLEGRLNRLDTAWTKFSVSVANSLVTDSLITGIESLNSLATVASKFIGTFGVLPILFTTVGGGALLASTKFRTLMVSLTTLGIESIKTRAGLTSMNSGLLTTTMSATTAKTNLQALGATAKATAISFGVIGGASLLLGLGLEYIVKKTSEAKQAQEDWKAEQEKNIDALTTNKDTVDELITKYQQYNSVIEKGGKLNTKDQQDYLSIQQQLAQMFPGLVQSIDASGQAHLGNSEQIQKEIDKTQKLVEIKKEQTKLEALSKFENNVDDLNSLQNKINGQKKFIDAMNKYGSKQSDIGQQKSALIDLEQQYADSTKKINDNVNTIANSYTKLKIDPEISNSIQNFISSLSLDKIKDADKLDSFSSKLGGLIDKIQQAKNTGNEKQFNSLVNQFKTVAKSMGATDVQLSNLDLSFDKLNKKNVGDKANSFNNMSDSIDGVSNSLDGSINKSSEQIDKLKELSTVEEQLVGVSQNQINATNDAILVMQQLGNNTSLTAEQEQLLADKVALLTALYPQLTNLINGNSKEKAKAIKIIEAENKANATLIQAYTLVADGKMSLEGKTTMVQLEQTNKRIKLINAEIMALDTLQQNYANIINNANKQTSSANNVGMLQNEKFSIQAYNKVNLKQADLAKLSGSQTKYTNSLQSTIDSINKNTSASNKNTKSKKDNNKETSTSIYLTDKYKQAMDKYNALLSKHENLMSKYPTYSKQYRKELEAQIKIKQKAINKTKEEYALLNKQIKSGKIYQKGSITVKTNSKNISKASNSTASLGYNGKYASTIKKYAKQYGVNPNLIAGIIKQESGFNAKARSGAGAMGLMQLMPATAKSLGVKNSYDPSQNIKGGTKLIAQLLKKYGGNVEKALRAYNAGPGNLTRSYGFTETNNYVKKVTSNYNSYLKKATDSVSKVSNSAVKTLTTNVDKTVNRKLKGWSGKVTQHYGNNGHLGIDIDGKKGQRLEANISGKVVSAKQYKDYSKGKNGLWTYGKTILVKGSNGKYYRYAHLDSMSVKKGDKVKVGQKLGTIGNTGNVVKGKNGDGSHLHYEVYDKKGKRISPESSAKVAKQYHKVSTSVKVSTQGVVTSSKQAIDEAKSTLLELSQFIDDGTVKIQEYRAQIIDSYLEEFDRNIQKREDKKSNRAINKERSTGDSSNYRKLVDSDISDTKAQIKEANKKKKYIEKLRKSKDITPAEKAKLGDELDKLKEQINGYTTNLINSYAEKVNSKIAQYDYKVELQDRKITTQTNLQDLMNNTSKAYNKSLDNQKTATKEKGKMLQSEYNYAVAQSKNLKLGYAEMRKQKQKADEIKNQIIQNSKDLADIENKKYDSKLAKNDGKISDNEYLLNRSQAYSDSLLENDTKKYEEFGKQIKLRRKLIDEMSAKNKDYEKALKDPNLTYEQKKAKKEEYLANKNNIIQLESDIRNMYKDTADYMIDLYKQVYEKRRDLELKAIDDERTRYQKLINDKINALQKLNDEQDHNDQKADYQKQISALEKKIKQYTGDDSRVGIYEKKKAEDDLANLNKEYEKFMRDYETQNKIDAWQNDLTNKENELDNATKATNKYFDNVLNDERKFNDIRQQIIKGNIKTFKDELSGMDKFITDNMGDIGEAIAQNISDQIKVATSKLGELNDNYSGSGADVQGTPDGVAQIVNNNTGGKEPSTKSGKITTVTLTNVYKTKKVNSKAIVTTIPKGKTVPYSTFDGKWYYLTYNNKSGYVYLSDLRATKTTTTKNKDGSTTKTTNVTDANGFISKTSTTTEGGLVNTVKTYDKNGKVTSTKYGNVKTTADVTYRTKPDKDVKPSGTFKKGTEMQIQAVGDYYAKVLYSGKTYYLDKSRLKAFKTGGFTGNDVPESGALALLHKKELVLNEQETKHILQTAKTVKGLKLPNANTPIIKPPSITIGQDRIQSNQIDKLINIEQFNGTEMDYKKMQNEMLKVMRKYGFSR